MAKQHTGQTADTRWSPRQYLKFADYRLRPAIELLQRIPLASPEVIVDLGCGAGKVTQLIAERWAEAVVYGVDSSREMLEQARTDGDSVIWQEADIGNWTPASPVDLIYSNAALHWVEDHARLFPRLAGFLRTGGCLAVQMPLSWGLPSHRLMRETLANAGADGQPLGTESLRRTVARKWVEDPQAYFDFLTNRTRSLDIWETEYLQVLEGEDPVLEWVKGTGLRPILHGLADDEREVFLAAYQRRLREAYPVKPNGCTLYPFRRLFIVALV